jgi:RHS repeat-associated protein
LTDKTGVKVVDYTYDPYGNTTADATIDNPFQYTGRENDNTGLYYYRARYYSPNQQRFISEDPIRLNGGINVYAYVGGNPISYIDPEGEAARSARDYELGLGGRGGGAIGGGGGGKKPIARPPGSWPADRGAAEWGRRNNFGEREGRNRFHGIKQQCGGRGQDDFSVNPGTGDVFDSSGSWVGNLGDVKPK